VRTPAAGAPRLARREGLRRRVHGIRLFVLSFAGLVVAGTAGLLLLPGLYTGPRLGVIDALFTAASAVCVTGLTVVDTATYFTGWGQAWLLLLIQAGGLGILAFATMIIQLLGGRGSLEVEVATGSGYGVRVGAIRSVLRPVFYLTLAIEGAGAVGLWLLWRAPLGDAGAVWPSVFHAISAFCNAGFSTFSDSLVGWRTSTPVLLTIGTVIVLGGLGFVVLDEVRQRWIRRSVRRLSTQSRLALSATAVLLVGATIVFLFFERQHSLEGLAPWSRFVNAVFMAVTPRTAGFNTVDYGQVSNPSLALTVALMIIGGAPGSTAGGLKVTSAALLLLGFWTRLRGYQHVSVGGRTVREESVGRAAALGVAGIAILAFATFLLLLVEPVAASQDRADFVRIVFEVHSAFGTVGLSMDKTGELTSAGRIVLIALMFVGRVGPLALAAAMAARRGPAVTYRYAYEDVTVG